MISVEKKTVEKYTVRGDGLSWSIFTLDDETGDISVQSDWGNYSYIWNCRGNGKSLKDFLITAGVGYVKDKFSYPCNGGKKHVYRKESLDNFKRDIINARRDHQIPKHYARSFYEALDHLDLHGDINTVYHSVENMVSYLQDSCELDLFDDGPWSDDYDFMENVVVGCSPQLNTFMEKVWPVFIDALKKERK